MLLFNVYNFNTKSVYKTKDVTICSDLMLQCVNLVVSRKKYKYGICFIFFYTFACIIEVKIYGRNNRDTRTN